MYVCYHYAELDLLAQLLLMCSKNVLCFFVTNLVYILAGCPHWAHRLTRTVVW